MPAGTLLAGTLLAGTLLEVGVLSEAGASAAARA
jgi:hypothetical protein